MMKHYFLPKEWMVSAGARHVYRKAAVISIAFLVLLIALQFVEEVPESWAVIVRFALLLGVASTALTLVAMEYFLFGFDTSSDGKKMLSFILMLAPVLGAAIYCLTSYSRQVQSGSDAPETANGATA